MSISKPDNLEEMIHRLVQECAEVIVEAQKIQRFGWNNYHPSDPDKTANHVRLHKGLLDVLKAWNKLSEVKSELTIPAVPSALSASPGDLLKILPEKKSQLRMREHRNAPSKKWIDEMGHFCNGYNKALDDVRAAIERAAMEGVFGV
ncbi:MAG: hypothetical protein ACLP05_04400 [Candidatus Kryptoniota bacterium]